jgi:hypothetical protein
LTAASVSSLATTTDSVCRTLRSYRKRLAGQQAAVPLPPAALRELEKELRLTILALSARAEGSVVDEVELVKLLKREEVVGSAGEKRRLGSGDAGNGEEVDVEEAEVGRVTVDEVGCQQSVGLDMDAVVGALAEVDLDGAER